MARTRYSPQQILVATGAGSPPVFTLAPSAPFRIYAAESGGSPLTDLTQADGTTALPVNGSGYPYCDLNGVPPIFYGPDGVSGVLWLDNFTGMRFPWVPSAQLHTTLTSGALLTNVTQAFAGPTSFTNASNPTAFTITPKVGVNDIAHAGNLATLFSDVTVTIAYLNATGQPYVIYVNAATGAWPNSGSRVFSTGAALTGLTTPVVWDSLAYQGAVEPAGRINGDRWRERVP